MLWGQNALCIPWHTMRIKTATPVGVPDTETEWFCEQGLLSALRFMDSSSTRTSTFSLRCNVRPGQRVRPVKVRWFNPLALEEEY